MPVTGLQLVGICSPFTSVKAITDHVVVLTNVHTNRLLHIVPLSAFPSSNPDAQATLTHPCGQVSAIFFTDDRCLCVFDLQSDKYSYSIIRIKATDPEFRQTTVEETYLPDLHGHRIYQHQYLPSNDVSIGVHLALWLVNMAPRPGQIHDNKITLRVATNETECGALQQTVHLVLFEPLPLSHLARAKGRWQIPEERHLPGTALYLDTETSLMFWMSYGGRRICLDRNRWLFVNSNNWDTTKDSIFALYDAAERSEKPCAEVENNGLINWNPTLAVSKCGRGMFAIAGHLYQFTAVSCVQSLEMLAAISTWEQLPEGKKKVISEDAPYDFQALVTACCEP